MHHELATSSLLANFILLHQQDVCVPVCACLPVWLKVGLAYLSICVCLSLCLMSWLGLSICLQDSPLYLLACAC